MGQGCDLKFINFVQSELRAGKAKIKIPAELLQGVSDEAMNEAKALIKLSGAKIVSINVT
jgi:hypothetical protein